MPALAQDKMTAAFSTVGFAYLPPLVAKAMNIYATEKLDVDIVITGGETKALAALIGGGADVYFGSAPTVIRARENGVQVLMVGYCVSQYATNLVLSSKWVKDHGLTANSTVEEKLKALKGATLGITAPGSGTDLIMRFFANKAGLNPDRDLILSNLGGGDVITSAFAQGRIDGFALSAPAAENAVKRDGAVMILDLAKGEVKELDGFLYTSISFREDTLNRNPQLAVRLLRTQQKALDMIRDPAKTNEARDAVWKMYWPKIDKALFDEMWVNWKDAWPKTVEIPASSLKQMVDFTNLLESKKIDPAVADKSYTNKYAKEAVASVAAGK
ncbi:ABC transporter substrate-binding protein [Xanthobacter sp. VNH20]|uniref:ABC transporter substrate-binding protein n=1 Tax=Xanthobacter sp. VNH20 TaxID=3156616 RepID=UPI0032B3844C